MGAVRRVCVGWWPESVVWCAVWCAVCGMCGVCGVSSGGVGCDVMESACEAVKGWWWLCVWMMLMRMRGRGCCVLLCVDVSLSGTGLGAKGGSAIVGALAHLSSLTTLEYVRSEGGV